MDSREEEGGAAPRGDKAAPQGAAEALREEALAGGERGKAAFERLWREYYRRLLAFAATYRGLPGAEREDAVAEALISAFGALKGYDPARPLAPWIYRIAANRFADAARRARRSSSLELGPGGGEGEGSSYDPPDPRDLGEAVAERDLVQRCAAFLAALPEVDRRVAQLRFYEGLGSREIGEALGMPAATVRWRVASIRSALAAGLGEEP